MKRRSLQNILRNNLKGLAGLSTEAYSARVHVVDEEYSLMDPLWLLDVIKTDPFLSPDKYKVNVFDCDDYVMHLRLHAIKHALLNEDRETPAVGFIFTKRHAFNFCVDDARKLHIINTQSTDHGIASDAGEYRTLLNISRKNPIKLVYI